MTSSQHKLKRDISTSLVVTCALLGLLYTLFSVAAFAETEPASTTTQLISSEQAGVMKFGFLSAAIAFGLGAIGAGVAIAYVGSASMAAVAEKPEIAGQALIFVALAEGLVVFGFITALMILGKF
ncbi:MAG: ATPase [Chitinivibrionales bacterium]|nr:ATPase [Chitinivibrionales bacterium]